MKNFISKKILVYIVLLLSLPIYAYTPPQSVLQKRISCIEQNGIENTHLTGEMFLSLGELAQYAFDTKMILNWEKIDTGKYVLNGMLNDDFTGKTLQMKILFSDRVNQDYILMDRVILNGKEIKHRAKLEVFKQFIMGVILNKRKVLTGTYEQKVDLSDATQYWEGGQIENDVQEERYFEFTNQNAIKEVKNTEYFKRLKQIHKNLVVFVEEKNENYIYLYLGFNKNGHMTRHAFLRVDLLGVVEYTIIPPKGENSWKLI